MWDIIEVLGYPTEDQGRYAGVYGAPGNRGLEYDGTFEDGIASVDAILSNNDIITNMNSRDLDEIK
jgi:hypothetical protein